FGGQRLVGPAGAELLLGDLHLLRGLRQRLRDGLHQGVRPDDAPGRHAAHQRLDLLAQLALRQRERDQVLAELLVRVLRAVTLDVERAGPDLALPLHQRAGLDHVAAAAGSAHLLGLSVVAAERADLDEVDVAGRVLRPGPRVVPDTRVVRDEVAGLYVQLLEVERVAGG